MQAFESIVVRLIICAAIAFCWSMCKARPATAGTYTWLICVGEQPVGSAVTGDHLSFKSTAGTSVGACTHNNNHTDSVGRTNDFNTYTRIHAPTGTSITSMTLDAVGNNYAYNRGWGYLAYTQSTSVFCSFYENQFPNASCGDGVSGFSTHGPKPILLPSSGDESVYLGIYCRDLTGCVTGTLDLHVAYWSVDLRDDVRPTVKLAGSAWTGDILSSKSTLDYVASDNGAGTTGVRVLIDGRVKLDTSATDAGGCDNTRWHYCPDDSGSVHVPLDGVSDGNRLLTVRTEDAAGNVSTDVARNVLVDNAPPVLGSVAVAGTPREGQELQCSAAVIGQSPRTAYQWSRADADGSGEKIIVAATAASYRQTSEDVGQKLLCQVTATDGGGTSTKKSTPTTGAFADGALVAAAPSGSMTSAATSAPAAIAAASCSTASLRKTRTPKNPSPRSYGHSRVAFVGGLVGSSGEARAGVVLDVVQTVVRAGAVRRKAIASSQTATDGRFRIAAPKGPSRALQLVVRGCGAVGRVVRQRVRGAVAARTTTRRVRNRQTAHFKGRVVGGYVGRGLGLELQVKVGRQWRDVKHTTSDSRGAFHVGYRFMRTFVRYTYDFRVVTRAGSAWPYLQGRSRLMKVRVN